MIIRIWAESCGGCAGRIGATGCGERNKRTLDFCGISTGRSRANGPKCTLESIRCWVDRGLDLRRNFPDRSDLGGCLMGRVGGKTMSEEKWKPIPEFPGYSVSDWGWIRNDDSGRMLRYSQNQYGVVNVGLVRNGVQFHRSVPLLVAKAFIPNNSEVFDTPINLDGDRWNSRVDNLAWRPRWFAVKYNQQFRNRIIYPIDLPIEDVNTGEISENSFECAKRYGLLESDIVLSIANRTYAWPTWQEFRVVSD